MPAIRRSLILPRGPHYGVAHGFAITPNDGADLTDITRALFVGGPGNVAVMLSSGAELVFQGVAAGRFCHSRRRIKATDTTATSILGLL